ncbi:stage II sporulation protein P [Clostridium polyendosporum]|uniref:Stage II sporulation protein P n=1 Tax=Clostridium polyendosporum TaxID=69208 RepID=A0A919RXI8_9CLOT|nr:stage II sporulation protein P [Clostridium polyendosporum]GIM28104.1 stage II sporulation protein P [Clostridium polyendosporum]
MYFNPQRSKNTTKWKPPAAFSVIVIVLIVFISGIIKTSIKDSNYIYIKLLQLTIPMVKNTSESADGINLEKISLRDEVAQKLNINFFNPSNLIAMEVPYFRFNETHIEYEESFATFDSFKLNDGSVAKLNPEELQNINDPAKPIKTSPAYNPNLKKTLNQSKPEVLIYHTHTTEAYSPASADSKDENYSVVGVGNVLESELEQNYGISVIHDKTMHSLNYEDSYSRSETTVKKYLQKYGDFKLIIDLHRDSVSNKATVTANLNGENVAKIMFVTAQNSQYYTYNAAAAERLNQLGRQYFPGFCKGIVSYRRGKNTFNQKLSKNSVLIEVGAELNTAQESQASAKYIARIIAEYLNEKR